MREIGSFFISLYAYAFVYFLLLYPTTILVELLGEAEHPSARAIKTASIILLPAALSWLLNDFVFGASSGLDDPSGARGVGPFEW